MTMRELFGLTAFHALGVTLFAIVVLTGPMNPLRIGTENSGPK